MTEHDREVFDYLWQQAAAEHAKTCTKPIGACNACAAAFNLKEHKD